MAINAPSPLKNEWKTLTAKLIVSVLFLFSNSSNFPLSDIALRKKKNHPREQSESWRGDSIFSVIDSDSCIQNTEIRWGLFRFSFLGLWVVKEHCADWARDRVAQNWSNSPGQILQDVRLLCKVMSMQLQQLQISKSMSLYVNWSFTYLIVFPGIFCFGFIKKQQKLSRDVEVYICRVCRSFRCLWKHDMLSLGKSVWKAKTELPVYDKSLFFDTVSNFSW